MTKDGHDPKPSKPNPLAGLFQGAEVDLKHGVIRPRLRPGTRVTVAHKNSPIWKDFDGGRWIDQ